MIILLIILIFVLWLLRKVLKIVQSGTFNVVTGGIKTGKSCFSFVMARIDYLKKIINWWLYNHFFKYLDWHNIWWLNDEKPLFYTNIPVKCEHVIIDNELLLRKKRFRYRSVLWLDEASLVADSQLIWNKDVNEELLLFAKLIGHELKGGNVWLNTQSIADLHYAFRRVCSNVIYTYSCKKLFLLPIMIFKVREFLYQEDMNTMNTIDKDLEEDLKLVILPSWVAKKYDPYCYSIITDDLQVKEDSVITNKLKTKNIVSFRKYKEKKINENNKENAF